MLSALRSPGSRPLRLPLPAHRCAYATRVSLYYPSKPAQPPPLPNDPVSVDPNHGLYAFFRQVEKPKKTEKGEDTGEKDLVYETFETANDKVTGRAWTAGDIRRKSFQDLHTLWYVLLRERNLLATQAEELRRMGVPDLGSLPIVDRGKMVRKSMARIKFVLNERRLAYEGVREKYEEEKAKVVAVKRPAQAQSPTLDKTKYNQPGWVMDEEALRRVVRFADQIEDREKRLKQLLKLCHEREWVSGRRVRELTQRKPSREMTWLWELSVENSKKKSMAVKAENRARVREGKKPAKGLTAKRQLARRGKAKTLAPKRKALPMPSVGEHAANKAVAGFFPTPTPTPSSNHPSPPI